MDLSQFKHQFKVKVQFHEVDLLGVFKTDIYFNFFETARLEYLKTIKQYREMENILNSPKFYLMVHNECDYFEPAYYDDELIIYTRIKYVKNSSFGFEHIVEKVSSGNLIAKGNAVIVYIDRASKKSIPLSDDFYTSVANYEGNIERLNGK
jgi:acyl-CoA thioester hydrolase